MTDPRFLQPFLKTVKTSIIGGNLVTARVAHAKYESPASTRVRGRKGREEATERGVLTGTGPDANVLQPGKNVVIYGLPGRLTSDGLRSWLQESTRKNLELEIFKVHP